MADITPQGVAKGFGLFVGVLFFLYWFLVGLSLLGDGFKIIAGDSAGTLFSAVSNPVAGLMVGILATVLVQSSSTTTSIIVAAAGSGVLDVATGIPMVFGANIGTSVTNTIVSLGFVGDKEQYRRGFSGATVHDMFNYMNVCLWLPLEAISSAINGGNGGVMFLITEAITRSFSPCVEEESPTGCEDWDGPLGIITDEIVERIVKVDSGVIRDFSYGRPELWHCQDLLCSEGSCEPYSFNQGRCTTSPLASAGICGEEGVEDDDSAEFSYCYYNGTTVATYDDIMLAAQEHFDGWKIVEGGALGDAGMQQSAGWVTLILSLVMLIVSLLAMVKLLGIAIRGAAEEVLQKALNMNGYLAILVGCGVTMFVQSSSITTSTLTPLVAMGTLTLEGMLPLTLGANLGTTLTGILASLVGTSVNGFQIAMAHVLFNVFGVVMFYPIPRVRQIPIAAARRLGDLAALFKAFPIFYIFMLFLVYPGFFLGVSIGITMGGGGLAGGVVGLLFFIIAHIGIFFWYWRKGGREFLSEKFGRTDENNKVDSVNPLAV